MIPAEATAVWELVWAGVSRTGHSSAWCLGKVVGRLGSAGNGAGRALCLSTCSLFHTFCLRGLSNTEKPNLVHVGSRPTKAQKCKLLGFLKVTELFPGHLCHVLLVRASPRLAQTQWGRGVHRPGLWRGAGLLAMSLTLTCLWPNSIWSRPGSDFLRGSGVLSLSLFSSRIGNTPTPTMALLGRCPPTYKNYKVSDRVKLCVCDKGEIKHHYFLAAYL